MREGCANHTHPCAYLSSPNLSSPCSLHQISASMMERRVNWAFGNIAHNNFRARLVRIKTAQAFSPCLGANLNHIFSSSARTGLSPALKLRPDDDAQLRLTQSHLLSETRHRWQLLVPRVDSSESFSSPDGAESGIRLVAQQGDDQVKCYTQTRASRSSLSTWVRVEQSFTVLSDIGTAIYKVDNPIHLSASEAIPPEIHQLPTRSCSEMDVRV